MPHLEDNIVSYMQLARPFTLIAPVVGALCCFMLTYGLVKVPLLNFILVSLALVLLNAGSNAINQVFDVEIDLINKPWRPIPSGAVSKGRAAAFGIILYFSALFVASFLSTWFFYLLLLLLFMTIAYSVPPFRFKKRGWIANIWLAISRGPIGITAAWSAFATPTTTPLIAGGIMGLFLVGAASTKDFPDIVGDKKNGVKTLPVMYGVEGAVRRITPFYIFPFLLIPLFVFFKLMPPTTLPLTLLSVYGILSVRFTLSPNKIDSGILAWRHMYFLLGLALLGFGAAYLCSYLFQI